MLSNVELLTLDFLNQSTQAWVELEYNRSIHEETGQTPLERMMKGPDVSRSSVESEALHFYFAALETRIQRHSDGTIQVKGVRFEIPSRFRHIKRFTVAFKFWDLSMAYLVDPKTGNNLGCIYPQDKIKNAQRGRRELDSISLPETPEVSKTESIPPLLRRLLADYAATGMPPAYLPREEIGDSEINDEDIF